MARPEDELLPAARESVELAFVAAIQHLPGNERAALLLREVLGFSAREVAELMAATLPAVNSALQRARRLVDERVTADSQQATLRSLGDIRLREIVESYTRAFEQADLDTLVGMLTEDATSPRCSMCSPCAASGSRRLRR